MTLQPGSRPSIHQQSQRTMQVEQLDDEQVARLIQLQQQVSDELVNLRAFEDSLLQEKS